MSGDFHAVGHGTKSPSLLPSFSSFNDSQFSSASIPYHIPYHAAGSNEKLKLSLCHPPKKDIQRMHSIRLFGSLFGIKAENGKSCDV